MGAKAQRKYCGKSGLLPGYGVDPRVAKEQAEKRQERRESFRIKLARKKLEMQGFVMDKFQKHIKRLTRG